MLHFCCHVLITALSLFRDLNYVRFSFFFFAFTVLSADRQGLRYLHARSNYSKIFYSVPHFDFDFGFGFDFDFDFDFDFEFEFLSLVSLYWILVEFAGVPYRARGCQVVGAPAR